MFIAVKQWIKAEVLCANETISVLQEYQNEGLRYGLHELNQLALWNRVPLGKFNRASAFPVRLWRTAGLASEHYK